VDLALPGVDGKPFPIRHDLLRPAEGLIHAYEHTDAERILAGDSRSAAVLAGAGCIRREKVRIPSFFV